jgi:DNA-binding transcriptional regulator YhcF (GntR family)
MAGALRISINLESPIPAYRQIADDVRRHLVDDRLKPGDQLPPVRQLALDLGVHFNTVALAYRLLADEGWLELKRGRGATVVARNAPRAVDRRQVDQLLRQVAQIAAQLRSAGMSSRQISAALRRLAQGAQP